MDSHFLSGCYLSMNKAVSYGIRLWISWSEATSNYPVTDWRHYPTFPNSYFLTPQKTIMTDIKHRRRRRWRRTGMINYVRSAQNERITEKGNLFRDPAFLLPSKVRILSRQIRYYERERRQRRFRHHFLFLLPPLLIKHSGVFIVEIMSPLLFMSFNPYFGGACKIWIKFIVSRMYTLHPQREIYIWLSMSHKLRIIPIMAFGVRRPFTSVNEALVLQQPATSWSWLCWSRTQWKDIFDHRNEKLVGLLSLLVDEESTTFFVRNRFIVYFFG